MVRTASRKLSSDAHVCAFIASAQSFCNCCSHAIVKSLRACTVLVREFITLPSSQLSCSMCPVQNHAGACCNCIRVRLYPISILFFQDLSETLAHFIQDILPQDLGLVLLPDLEYIRDLLRCRRRVWHTLLKLLAPSFQVSFILCCTVLASSSSFVANLWGYFADMSRNACAAASHTTALCSSLVRKSATLSCKQHALSPSGLRPVLRPVHYSAVASEDTHLCLFYGSVL